MNNPLFKAMIFLIGFLATVAVTSGNPIAMIAYSVVVLLGACTLTKL